jgi:hypothetical protein
MRFRADLIHPSGDETALTTKLKRRRRDKSLAHPEGERMRAEKGGSGREIIQPRRGGTRFTQIGSVIVCPPSWNSWQFLIRIDPC